jgi:carbamoyltransferase
MGTVGAGAATKPAYVLGLSAFYHDSAACLLRDGRIVAAAEEERFTRRKHDPTFPIEAIRYVLGEAGISASDLAAIAFYEKPFLKFDRLMAMHLSEAPRGSTAFIDAMPRWLRRNLVVKQVLERELGFKGKVYFPEHHEAHAAAAFFASPFSEAAILTLDGVGEWATTSLGRGQTDTASGTSRIELAAELHFPHSLGLLYSAFTAYCGFKVNSGEYKLMGLAPYGKPVYKQAIYDHLIDVKADGSFRLRGEYLQFVEGSRLTRKAFDDLFGGAPRQPESPIDARFMDVARSAQEVLEERVLALVAQAHRECGSENLCLAGGVALNCVANGRIVREGPFKHLFVQPAAGDAGGALGAAFFAWHQIMGQPRRADGLHDAMQGARLGPRYAPDAISGILDDQGIPYRRLSEAERIEMAAQKLAAQRTVGWFDGRMEFGPRALGSRSILADPRDPAMKERVNATIKQREGFRPFGCAVLQERVSEVFEFTGENPYMLIVAQACKALNASGTPSSAGYSYPAITHVDGSARLQTVTAADGALYALMKRFEALTGCPVLLNTSFNLRSEPLVNTPQEAYACFRRSALDDLFLENCLLTREDQKPWHDPQGGLPAEEWD